MSNENLLGMHCPLVIFLASQVSCSATKLDLIFLKRVIVKNQKSIKKLFLKCPVP